VSVGGLIAFSVSSIKGYSITHGHTHTYSTDRVHADIRKLKRNKGRSKQKINAQIKTLNKEMTTGRDKHKK
jgi:hypothetical protein